MNEVLIWLVLCALAAFRLSEALVIDDGPFNLFFHLRCWAQSSGKPPTGALAELLKCVHCAGLWMALLTAILYYSRNIIPDFILFFLAVAGLQSVIAGKLGRSS